MEKKNKERMRICAFAAAFDLILAVESELNHFYMTRIFAAYTSG